MADAKENVDRSAERKAAAAIAALYAGDAASQALGMEIIESGVGRATVRMTVREEMLNGHRLCHGGLVFSLADSAFAFACNSHGEGALAGAASIDFLLPAKTGDTLTARAVEIWRGGRNGITEVTVTNQEGARVALFRGRSTVVRR
jgi:acyl-CoA thioesterase